MQKISEQGAIATKLMAGDDGYTITRGTAHSISSYCEDLFARFVAEGVGREDFVYWVDKNISTYLLGRKRAVSFKPDLAILQDQVLTHYFDVKTNMGWNRNFETYLKKKNDFVAKIQGKEAWMLRRNKGRQPIIISPDLKYQMVIIFGWNINQEVLADNLRNAGQYEHVIVHLLAPRVTGHPHCEADERSFENVLKTILL